MVVLIKIWKFITNNLWRTFAILFFLLLVIQHACRNDSIRPVNKFIELKRAPVELKFNYRPKITFKTPPKIKIIKGDTVIKEIPAIVDTNAILASYFSTNHYDDVLKDDSIAFISVHDDVSRNKIINRNTKIQIHPVVLKQEPVRKLFVGAGLGGSIDKFGLSGKLLYIDKKQNAFEYSYNPIIGYHEVSAFFLIRFRSKKPP